MHQLTSRDIKLKIIEQLNLIDDVNLLQDIESLILINQHKSEVKKFSIDELMHRVSASNNDIQQKKTYSQKEVENISNNW